MRLPDAEAILMETSLLLLEELLDDGIKPIFLICSLFKTIPFLLLRVLCILLKGICAYYSGSSTSSFLCIWKEGLINDVYCLSRFNCTLGNDSYY